jgi:hypothetical protein
MSRQSSAASSAAAAAAAASPVATAAVAPPAARNAPEASVKWRKLNVIRNESSSSYLNFQRRQ